MNWNDFLTKERGKSYYDKLMRSLEKDSQWEQVFPPEELRFAAFENTPFEKVKVVILGQDPYYSEGQAMGLSFSVPEDVAIPPSLRNIFHEVEDDLGIECQDSGDLTRWARQGVFLLNASLTVREGSPNSHALLGWQTLTDNAIAALNERDNIVYMLWGNFAKKKKNLITNPTALILEASHPSPLSAYKGFFGCKHFSKANEFLTSHGATPIDWR